MALIVFLLIPIGFSVGSAQGQTPAATPAVERLKAHGQWEEMLDQSRFRNVELRSVGPTIMSGRILDIYVSPKDPTHFYVAYASGGLWKTTSNGTSFQSVTDSLPVITIGDVEVIWSDPEVIFLGTGENNSSRSSYSGTGVYVSEDGGSSWKHAGLAETHHIGRIIAHPDNPDTVIVAAIGHLYSKNPERGIFRTVDGGQTWQQTLAIDDSTGVIDLVMDVRQPDILYAAAWHRQRHGWNFVEGGPTSGIYRSVDGGVSWTLMTTADSGFPTGDGVGRIGLAMAPSAPDTLYAVVDNQEVRPDRDEDEPDLTFEMLEQMDTSTFLEDVSLDDLEEYLDYHGFPDEYSPDSVRSLVEAGKAKPADLVTYVGDANRALFNTPVIGCEVYLSSDGGESWTRTHEDYLDDTCYTYGYYFGQIWVSPHDPTELYIAGVPLLKSTDGGATWQDVGQANVHVDHHAMWLNPQRPGHLLNGNDGGLNMTYDGGQTWLKLNTPSVGQFYTVNVDNQEPFNVYGGLQDNGVWFGPSTYEESVSWHEEGRYPYRRILGGDGMMVEIDPRDPNVVYAGSQFGYYSRLNLHEDSSESVRPKHELGDEPYRFNWLTPIHLSEHNADILYLGSNVVHRSLDRGDSWTEISGDLTKGKVEGNVPFGTLTAIVESPLKFGLLYAGSDDGLIHRSHDAGGDWVQIDEGLPAGLWVSRIEASRHDEARVYLSLNGYRHDHMEPYLYVSEDYGTSWTRIGNDLPLGPVNVVREDPRNADILYAGTDRGTFVSLDRGRTFEPLGSGRPAAPVHDLAIQRRDRKLAIGTHGRSIYLADVSHIQSLTEGVLSSPLHAYAVDSLKFNEDWGERPGTWDDFLEPESTIAYYSKTDGLARISVSDEYDNEMASFHQPTIQGLNFASYDVTTCESCLANNIRDARKARSEEDEVKMQPDADEPEAADNGRFYLRPGSYVIQIELDGSTRRVSFNIFE